MKECYAIESFVGPNAAIGARQIEGDAMKIEFGMSDLVDL